MCKKLYIIYNKKYLIGDHPELQSESGNSQGGDFPCMCRCPVNQFNNLNYTLSQNIMTLEQRRQKVISYNLKYNAPCLSFCPLSTL